jgi:hypothetical protein
LLALLTLRGVPNRGYGDTTAPVLINDNIRGAADDQFAIPGLGSGASQAGMISQGFYDRDDAHCQALGSVRLVQREVGANFSKAGSSQWRPNTLPPQRLVVMAL